MRTVWNNLPLLLYLTWHSLNCLFLQFTAWHRTDFGQGLLSHSTLLLNPLTVEAPDDIRRGGEVLHIVNMEAHSSATDMGLSPVQHCSVTLGLSLHGWTLPGRIVLYCIAANSHLIPQARTSLSIHQWLISRVWRAEPALSGYFSRSLFRHPLLTSKHDYFYLHHSAAVWTRKLGKEMSVSLLQAPTTGIGDMGAGRLASLRWDWVVHTSPVTPLWVLLVWVTCKFMLVVMTGYSYITVGIFPVCLCYWGFWKGNSTTLDWPLIINNQFFFLKKSKWSRQCLPWNYYHLLSSWNSFKNRLLCTKWSLINSNKYKG